MGLFTSEKKGFDMKETNVQQLIRVEASKLGATLWRNNTGKLQDKTGRWVSYGLCVGSSDLIGMYKGRFLAIEVKQKGKQPTVEQQQFIDFVNKNGGIAFVCDDVKNLQNLLEKLK